MTEYVHNSRMIHGPCYVYKMYVMYKLGGLFELYMIISGGEISGRVGVDPIPKCEYSSSED